MGIPPAPHNRGARAACMTPRPLRAIISPHEPTRPPIPTRNLPGRPRRAAQYGRRDRQRPPAPASAPGAAPLQRHLRHGRRTLPAVPGRLRSRGWRFMVEPELHLGPEAHPDILVPDLAGWRLDRMPSFTDAAFVTLAPDCLCEILSPSTRRFDVGEKRALYATHGVAHLWLLDPDARTLETFTLAAGKWVLDATFHDDEEVRAAPFEAVGLSLGALWG